MFVRLSRTAWSQVANISWSRISTFPTAIISLVSPVSKSVLIVILSALRNPITFPSSSCLSVLTLPSRIVVPVFISRSDSSEVPVITSFLISAGVFSFSDFFSSFLPEFLSSSLLSGSTVFSSTCSTTVSSVFSPLVSSSAIAGNTISHIRIPTNTKQFLTIYKRSQHVLLLIFTIFIYFLIFRIESKSII